MQTMGGRLWQRVAAIAGTACTDATQTDSLR